MKTADIKKAWIERYNDAGEVVETIPLTPAEAHAAPEHYGDEDLANLFVEDTNGEKWRPYRFITTNPTVEQSEDDPGHVVLTL